MGNLSTRRGGINGHPKQLFRINGYILHIHNVWMWSSWRSHASQCNLQRMEEEIMEDLSWILEDMDEDDVLDLEDKLKEKEVEDE